MAFFTRPMVFTLTDACNRRLKRRTLELAYPGKPDFEAFLRASREIVRAGLPKDLIQGLRSFKDGSAKSGILVIRNLPQDDHLPPTPLDARRSPEKATHVSEVVLAGIGALLGEPYAYAAEKDGELIHDVAPTAAGLERPTNESSRTSLGLHTELAYFPDPPAFLPLLGLRSDPEGLARTPVLDIRDIVPGLPAELDGLLRGPHFRHMAPYIFHDSIPEGRRVSPPSAILGGNGENPTVRVAFYGGITTAMDSDAEAALDALASACDGKARNLTIKPGEMAILSNRHVLHARSAFQARFDGTDRWLQRINVAASTTRLPRVNGEVQRILSLQ